MVFNREEVKKMQNFQTVLYEAVLVAFGKILAKYDVFTQGVIMRDIGKEVVAYLNEHGFDFQETGSVEDLNTLINLFVKNGFAEALEVTPADKGDNYILDEPVRTVGLQGIVRPGT